MPALRRLSLLLALALVLGAAGAGAEEASLSLRPVEFPVCEPPLSTCRMGPIPLEPRQPELGPSILSDDCPKGYSCTCVPSCPTCKDCDAQVCLRDPTRECKTACDCQPGLGCFEGRCLAGIAPVYCCDSPICPAGGMCQGSDGVHDLCPRVDDAMCRERQRKISALVHEIVEAGKACHEDSDCAFIGTSTGCGGTCGDYINEDNLRKARRKIAWLDRKICSTYVKDGCPFATPGCLPTRGKCIRGRCEGVPRLPYPGPDPRPLDEVVLPLNPDQSLELQAR